jgi:GNAT superfamily N-acetyltransferase
MSIEPKARSVEVSRYLFRPAIDSDLEQVVALLNAWSVAVTGRPSANESATRLEWQTPGFSLLESTRVVTSSRGSLVGYIEVWDLDAIPASVWVWGRVHTDHEGLGIGTGLMNWAETRAREVFGRVPVDAQVSMLCGALDSHSPANRLLESRSMVRVRKFAEMRIELDKPVQEPLWPANITVKDYAELPDLDRVHQVIVESFRDHWDSSINREKKGWSDGATG